VFLICIQEKRLVDLISRLIYVHSQSTNAALIPQERDLQREWTKFHDLNFTISWRRMKTFMVSTRNRLAFDLINHIAIQVLHDSEKVFTSSYSLEVIMRFVQGAIA